MSWSVTCSVFMEVMELICPDMWFMLPPPLAMTPRFMLLLLLYNPPLGCVEYCDWDCWGYTLEGGKLSERTCVIITKRLKSCSHKIW